MSGYDFNDVLLPAFLIYIVAYILSFLLTKSVLLSFFLSVIKSLLFVIYFVFVFDGSYVLGDDLKYLEGGKILYDNKISIFNIGENTALLSGLVGGTHFGYYPYNAYAFKFFGFNYFSPVALNIIISVLIAYIAVRFTASELKYNSSLKRLFFIFLMLHPEMLTWSTVYNGKEVLVLLLHVLLIWGVSLLYSGKVLKSFIVIAIALTALVFMRFYIIPIFIAALVITTLLHTRSKGKKILAAFLSVAVFAFLWSNYLGTLSSAYNAIISNFVNPIYGVFRFLLSPLPFNVEDKYQFLYISISYHWLVIPFAILGGVLLYKIKTPFFRFLFIYSLLILLLYSIYGELQGVRHRFQLLYILALFQFTGLLMIVKNSTINARMAGKTKLIAYRKLDFKRNDKN